MIYGSSVQDANTAKFSFFRHRIMHINIFLLKLYVCYWGMKLELVLGHLWKKVNQSKMRHGNNS